MMCLRVVRNKCHSSAAVPVGFDIVPSGVVAGVVDCGGDTVENVIQAIYFQFWLITFKIYVVQFRATTKRTIVY